MTGDLLSCFLKAKLSVTKCVNVLDGTPYQVGETCRGSAARKVLRGTKLEEMTVHVKMEFETAVS